jgi:Tol biopolymer transport system component
MVDLERGFSSRFTTSSSLSIYPIWAPDGRTVMFNSAGLNLFRKDADGAGEEQRVLESPRPAYPTDWSRDGRFVLYQQNASDTQRDLWILPVTSDGKAAPDSKPRPYLQSKFNESDGRFSPEPSPRWVAYQSDESGRYEVYIAAFPEPRGKFQVSTGGGQYAQWGPSGRELFYVAPDNKLMVVDLNISGDSVRPSAPRVLFTLPVVDNGWSPYDTSADGQRFLVRAIPPRASQALTLIVNWPALLSHP